MIFLYADVTGDSVRPLTMPGLTEVQSHALGEIPDLECAETETIDPPISRSMCVIL